MLPRFKNTFLNSYLDYVAETESPRIFHIWSALTGISAAMGRRVTFTTGWRPYFPNMYTVLVGPPATQKTTAMMLTKKLLAASTGVRFAPADTSGQRQGLIAAMADSETSEDLDAALDAAINASALATLTQENLVEKLSRVQVDGRDRNVMFICAEELNMFLGTNSLEMLTFLLKMWDGDDYDYRLKASNMILSEPLLNMVGCTTPAMIAESMPAAAMGQGFTSRMIFVYCDTKFGSFPRGRLHMEHEEYLRTVYSDVFYNMQGPMTETKEAAEFLDEMHEWHPEIRDPRFVHYVDRRKAHLIKLAMALCAARQSMEIKLDDVETAHMLLQVTEKFMPDALGEYGLSPLAASKQRLVEFIVAAKEPVTINVLWAVMHKEMKRVDFISCLADLTNAGKITMVNTNEGPAYVEKLRLGKKGLSVFDEMFPPGCEQTTKTQ